LTGGVLVEELDVLVRETDTHLHTLMLLQVVRAAYHTQFREVVEHRLTISIRRLSMASND
jgi:hypothetical protein